MIHTAIKTRCGKKKNEQRIGPIWFGIAQCACATDAADATEFAPLFGCEGNLHRYASHSLSLERNYNFTIIRMEWKLAEPSANTSCKHFIGNHRIVIIELEPMMKTASIWRETKRRKQRINEPDALHWYGPCPSYALWQVAKRWAMSSSFVNFVNTLKCERCAARAD